MNEINKIQVNTTGNYPIIEGAGLIGEIANKRISDYWVHANYPNFPSVNQILLDILVEDYNERHAPGPDSEGDSRAKEQPSVSKPTPATEEGESTT